LLFTIIGTAVMLTLSCRTGFILPDNRDLFLEALNVLAGRLSATGSCSQVAFNSIVR